MDLTTQLGGSYRPENHALFTVKRKLEAAEMQVRHPMANEFVVVGDRTYGYNPDAWTHEEVELDQLSSIATSDVHVVCNELGDKKGYIGPHSAQCMLYALLKDKPIVLLHTPQFAQQIEPRVKRILQAHQANFHIIDLQNLPPKEILQTIRTLVRDNPQYGLNDQDKEYIQKRIQEQISQLN